MARASDHFRQSDVTFWGMVALVTAGVAVLGSNISALAPRSIISALHSPRTTSTSVEGLRDQVSTLQSDLSRLKQDHQTLQSRTQVQEKSGNDVVRRVGALEITLPRILEATPQQRVDISSHTASVGEITGTVERAAEGGTVAVRQTPYPATSAPQVTEPQPLPPPIDAGTTAAPPNPIPYGVAIGGFVPETQAVDAWRDLEMKIGPLLLEFSPLISAPTGQGTRLLFGPMETLAEARQMCERLERIAFSCLPVSYEGRELFAENSQ